jgi:NADH:ubiquinone oxidoreductase subunit 3 (subunit A)
MRELLAVTGAIVVFAVALNLVEKVPSALRPHTPTTAEAAQYESVHGEVPESERARLASP